MKNTSALLAVLALASQNSVAVQMNCQYSGNMIDVGNIDIFQATWQTIYAANDNGQGVVSDQSYSAYDGSCVPESDSPNLSVRVQMNGAWGSDGNVSEYQMRDAIAQTMWKVLDTVAQNYSFPVYYGCSGLVWQDTPAYNSSAACGPKSSVSCASFCANENTPTFAQCTNGGSGYKVPSKLVVTTYNGTELLPNQLTVQFSSSSTGNDDTGCGIVGYVAQTVASFIPVVGGLFSAGIKMECNN